MFNIALAWAFLISFHFSIGSKALSIIVPPEAIRLLPPYQQHIATIFANYWLPATLIYILFRVVNAQKLLRPSSVIHFLLGSANVLLLIYVCMRILASSIPGGGASFALVSFSGYVLIPCKFALYVGTLWLIFRSLWLNHKNIASPELLKIPFYKSISGIVALVMLFPPIGYFTWFYTSYFEQINTAQVKRNSTNSRFSELCNSVRIEINGRSKKPDGVYFDGPNQYYMSMLNELDFVEVHFPNNRIQRISKKDNQPAVVNFKIQDVNRKEISKPSARYEIKTKWPQNEADSKLGILSKEIIILDRTNNQVLAKYTTVRRTKGVRVVDTCPKNIYFFEGNIAKYVLGMTDELKAEGINVKMSPN